MKKKLLSLVLAGAMVASTSVSAFAATDTVETGNITMSAGDDQQDVNIGITGNILDNKGNAKPGTISVTVPTAVTFTVANNGTLTSADMVIRNNSTERISIVAKKFEDSDGVDNINVINKTEFEAAEAEDGAKNERNKIWLKLTGGTNEIGLTSESDGKSNGKMYKANYRDEVKEETDYEIKKLNTNESVTLKLEGKGGTKGDIKTEAIQDEFKLILKIKRDKN